MSQLWRFMVNNPYVVFVIITVVFSIVGRIIKALSAQAEQRRRVQSIQRAELDALRTGRAPEPVPAAPAPAPSARHSLEEMAKVRQAEIARRRAQRSTAGSSQPRPPRPPRPVTRTSQRSTSPGASSGVSAPSRRPGDTRGVATPPPAGRQSSLSIPTQAPNTANRPTQPSADRTQRQPQAQAPHPADPEQGWSSTKQLLKPDAAETVTRRPARSPMANDLRRAIILREILGPPVSMQ